MKEKDYEYRRPDDIHPFKATRKPVKHVNQNGGDEKWYQ